MALRRTRLVQGLPGAAAGGGAESQSSMRGHINLEMKQAGKPSAGNPPAGFDVAGAGNRLTVRLVRHSQRKRGATDRPDLRSAAPVLDPTDERGTETGLLLNELHPRRSSTLPRRRSSGGAANGSPAPLAGAIVRPHSLHSLPGNPVHQISPRAWSKTG
jgi:hypothetical protein